MGRLTKWTMNNFNLENIMFEFLEQNQYLLISNDINRNLTKNAEQKVD